MTQQYFLKKMIAISALTLHVTASLSMEDIANSSKDMSYTGLEGEQFDTTKVRKIYEYFVPHEQKEMNVLEKYQQWCRTRYVPPQLRTYDSLGKFYNESKEKMKSFAHNTVYLLGAQGLLLEMARRNILSPRKLHEVAEMRNNPLPTPLLQRASEGLALGMNEQNRKANFAVTTMISLTQVYLSYQLYQRTFAAEKLMDDNDLSQDTQRTSSHEKKALLWGYSVPTSIALLTSAPIALYICYFGYYKWELAQGPQYHTSRQFSKRAAYMAYGLQCILGAYCIREYYVHHKRQAEDITKRMTTYHEELDAILGIDQKSQ